MNNQEILECQKNWLDKLQVHSPKPILIKALEGKIPIELKGTNAEALYRWSYYKDVWGLIRTPYFTRSILANEIVLDPDTPHWDNLKQEYGKIILTLKKLSIPFILAYSGGKGCHLHIFFKVDGKSIPDELFDKADENKYDLYRAFRQYVFEYVIKESDASIKLLDIDKPKINWQIFSMGSQVRDFGTLRKDGFCKTLITEMPLYKPINPLPLVFPQNVEMWKIPEEMIPSIINKIKSEIVHQTKYNKTELPIIQGLKIEDIPCIKNIMNGLSSGRYYGAGAIALAGKQLKYSWEQTELVVETFLSRCDGLQSNEIQLRIDNSHQLFLSEHSFSCKWVKETLKCINPSECVVTIARNEQREKETKTDFVAIAEGMLSVSNFLTLAELDEVYNYKDGIYHPLGEVFIKTEVQKQYDELTTHDYNEIINYIKRKTYIPYKAINNHYHLVALDNGIYNLNTNQLEQFTPTNLITVKSPVTYNPNTDCPNIKRFFADVLNPDDIIAIEEFFGYCLLRNYPIQKSFMLVGSGGNGKSTLLTLLKTFLGVENVTSLSLQELEDNHFAGANLLGKLANIYADLPPKALASTGKIKMLTGGDIITAEKKFGGFVSFINYAKMIFSTNQMPMSYDDTDAFYRRWVIVNFPHSFDETKGKGLINTLTTPEELSGLLNVALCGLQRLLDNGRFSNQKQIDEVREQYVRMSDSIQGFIWDCLDQNFDNFIEKKELYTIYGKYCKSRSLPISSEKRFFTRFPMMCKVEEFRPEVDKKRVQAYMGIILKIDITSLDILYSSVKDVKDVKDNAILCKSIGHQQEAQQQEILEHNREKSLTSLTWMTDAVTELKKHYDSLNKPEQNNLNMITDNMIATLMSELDDDIDEESIRKVVMDYQKGRNWI